MQSYFPTGQIFFHPPENWEVSKYTAMLSELSFQENGKELSLSFRW